MWAPHVVRRSGYWYMAYAGVDRHGTQRLGIVRSADPHDWERFLDGPVLDAARFPWFDRNAPHAHFYDCRDPFLLEHGDGYLLYYTARADDDVPCIAAASSDDLLHWQDRGPVLRMVHYQPDGQQRTPLEWLFRWADPERNLHIHKTRSFFGVLRFGLVRWEGDRMLPDHGPAADYQMPWP